MKNASKHRVQWIIIKLSNDFHLTMGNLVSKACLIIFFHAPLEFRELSAFTGRGAVCMLVGGGGKQNLLGWSEGGIFSKGQNWEWVKKFSKVKEEGQTHHYL